jgi:peptide/nickel transport system ATP-binding protein
VTFLLISHDLGVVAHICETTAVMYRGRIVELGETDALFANPAHPYTRELVDATPRLDRPMRAPPASLDRDAVGWDRHREERSDAAIQEPQDALRPPGLLRFARNDELVSEAAEGCPYVARCAFARPRCQEEAPALETKGGGSRKVACHFPLD